MLVPQFVTLVRRAERGDYPELTYGGQVLEPPPGPAELTVPIELASWILRNHKYRAWTLVDGQPEYIHRFGIKDAPKEFIELTGAEFTDTAPFELLPVREQWEAPPRRPEQYIPVPGIAPNMLAREIREATSESL